MFMWTFYDENKKKKKKKKNNLNINKFNDEKNKF